MIYQCFRIVILCNSLANSQDPMWTAALAHNLAKLHVLLSSCTTINLTKMYTCMQPHFGFWKRQAQFLASKSLWSSFLALFRTYEHTHTKINLWHIATKWVGNECSKIFFKMLFFIDKNSLPEIYFRFWVFVPMVKLFTWNIHYFTWWKEICLLYF